MRDKLRSGFEKNKVVAEDHVDELCNRLDRELTGVINAYLRSVTDAACKSTKEVLTTLVPKEPGEVGISLPALTEKKLNEAIDRKNKDVKAQLTKQVEGRVHVTWYAEEVFAQLDESMTEWGEVVRARSRELSRSWTLRGSFVLALIVPLAISMVLYSTRYCKPGTYAVASEDGEEEGFMAMFSTTPQQCAVCPAGKYSAGGFFASSSCTPCGRGTYADKKGAGKCASCPAHSVAVKSTVKGAGSTSCVCTADAAQTSAKGKPLVCKVNKKGASDGSKGKGQSKGKGKGKDSSIGKESKAGALKGNGKKKVQVEVEKEESEGEEDVEEEGEEESEEEEGEDEEEGDGEGVSE